MYKHSEIGENYLVVSPDRYGRFGHQTLSILAGIYCAYRFGFRVILPKYMYFAEHWNDLVNWSLCELVDEYIDLSKRPNLGLRVIYLGTDYTDEHGNNKYDLSSPIEYGYFCEALQKAKATPSIVFMPFDQQLPVSQHHCLYTEEFRNILQDVISMSSRKVESSAANEICIHIRRGDVSHLAHTDNYVNDEFYYHLVRCILLCTDLACRITIYVQGVFLLQQDHIISRAIAHGQLRVNSQAEAFHNRTDCDAFVSLMQASILVCSDSSFPRLAALFGSPRGVINISRRPFRFFPRQLNLNPDMPIDQTSLKEFIHEHTT